MSNQSISFTHIILFLGAMSILIAACKESHDLPSLPLDVEAISLLGDTLRIPELPADTEREFRDSLDAAMERYRMDPEDPDAIIGMGLRLANLGYYRDAVRTFTEGTFKHPEDARFYRHRGHRYLTLRLFDAAVDDLEMAASLLRGTPVEMEPDGLPDVTGEPEGTLQTKVWYHLGLAHYLNGDFRDASESFRNSLDASENDDMKVAVLYWYYMAERRTGNDEYAGSLLNLVEPGMEILENDKYHQLLLVFDGQFDADKLLETAADALEDTIIGYGIGNWHYINGRAGRASEIWNHVVQGDNWAASGFIAAEAELARI